MVNKKPYSEKILSKNYSIRTFNQNVDLEDLKWHFDEEDRIVEVIGETDWLFQFDDELPFTIKSPISIPKGRYHRIIKGEKDLVVKIFKPGI